MLSPEHVEPQGLDRFASALKLPLSNYTHKPCWRCAYVYLLERGDYESAQLVRDRNEDNDERP